MATYVNNLRLKEIATGDESGTWGTSTNTNLELIGEALGFGTEAITTNADTHTTTIADGSADEGRAMYIKYTGTLDSACTITIGPNTLKRVHMIENATSGSQNIIISQGSGASITIGPGDTKVVYLDGAGSGAAVVDAFVDLDLSGGSVNVSTVKTNSGDMTFDSAGDIILDADGADLIFKDGGTAIAHLTNSSSDFVIETKVQDKDFIIKGDDGGSGITALTIDMSSAGAATFNNDVTAFSDKRLKTDISPIENALEKVMQMQGVYYKRNDVENARTQVGVLAQDMEGIVPEVVLTADDEMQTKSVDYGKLTAVLMEAVKQLSNEVTHLKQQIINGG
tara:strand:- start:11696 stop:12709 length:1014 start_codon:yes stop_codon:yes gene_type:complete